MLVIGKNRSFQAVTFPPSMSGGSFCIRVTPYSRSGSHINEVLWIFADEEVE